MNETVNNFFSTPSNSNLQVKRIVEQLKIKNNSFIVKLANNEGFPKWDKIEFKIVKKNISQIRSQSINSTLIDSSIAYDTIALIPLVLQNDKSVNSFIACKLERIIAFQLYERNNYKQFGYIKSNNTPEANDITRKFLSMDHRVFGYTKFGILDSALSFFKPKPRKGFNFYSLQYKGNSMNNISTQAAGDACEEEAWFYDDGYGNIIQVSNWNDVGGPCEPDTRWVDSYDPNWGGGSGTGSGGSGGQPIDNNGYFYSQIGKLQAEISYNSFTPIPCQYLQQFYNIGNFKAPPSVLSKVYSMYSLYASAYYMMPSWLNSSFGIFPYGQAKVQDILEAKGTVVNCDYFPVHITQLPSINGVVMKPNEFLEYFRLNINSFINKSTATFNPYVDILIDETSSWNSNNPLGSILHIDMINDGSVVVSDYLNNDPFLNQASFTVTTLKTPLDGMHPVSGNRRFGIQVDNVNGGYTFYVSAVDRITSSLFEVPNNVLGAFGFQTGFDQADALWRGMQYKIISFITASSSGGSASLYNGSPEIIARPKFDDIKTFLQNPNMSIAELKILMGC